MLPRPIHFMSENQDSSPPSRSLGAALRWIVLAVALLAGLWFGIQALRNLEPEGAPANAGGDQQGPPPATVITAPVVQKAVQERRRVVGTLRAVQRAEVAAQESGAVDKVLVDVGDIVEKGDILVEMDPRRINASLAEARARLTAATAVVSERAAEAERAERDLTMKDSLYRQRAVSEREFLDAQREASVSAARKDAAEEEREAALRSVELLEVSFSDLKVKAPFAGRVVERSVDPGEWLSVGGPVVTLVSSGAVEAWIQVPERFVAEISEQSDQLEIVVDGNGFRAPAKSIRQVADIDPVTRLFPVVVTIDDAGGKLVPGLSVHAELPVGERSEMIGVPVDAVIETFQGASVFRAAPVPDQAMPIAERVPVAVAFRKDGFIYLEPGVLKLGQQVVIEGNERLFPGTPLILAQQPEDDSDGTIEEIKQP